MAMNLKFGISFSESVINSALQYRHNMNMSGPTDESATRLTRNEKISLQICQCQFCEASMNHLFGKLYSRWHQYLKSNPKAIQTRIFCGCELRKGFLIVSEIMNKLIPLELKISSRNYVHSCKCICVRANLNL